ncbi:MAG: amino acid ABC transporter ATP-binding protein, partial [Mesorhizobium sp.]
MSDVKSENRARFGVPADSMVFARGVRKTYGQLEVLKGVDLDVPEGSVACIIGPSGSGKSTFLRCINHLEKLSGGILLVDSQFVGYDLQGDKLYEVKDDLLCRRRAEIGMLFQS